MESIKRVKLGEVDFYGRIGTVFREIYSSGEWKFVILIENERIVMLSY